MRFKIFPRNPNASLAGEIAACLKAVKKLHLKPAEAHISPKVGKPSKMEITVIPDRYVPEMEIWIGVEEV